MSNEPLTPPDEPEEMDAPEPGSVEQVRASLESFGVDLDLPPRRFSRGERFCFALAAMLLVLYAVLHLLGARELVAVYAGLLQVGLLGQLVGALYGLLHVLCWFLVPPLIVGPLASYVVRDAYV